VHQKLLNHVQSSVDEQDTLNHNRLWGLLRENDYSEDYNDRNYDLSETLMNPKTYWTLEHFLKERSVVAKLLKKTCRTLRDDGKKGFTRRLVENLLTGIGCSYGISQELKVVQEEVDLKRKVDLATYWTKADTHPGCIMIVKPHQSHDWKRFEDEVVYCLIHTMAPSDIGYNLIQEQIPFVGVLTNLRTWKFFCFAPGFQGFDALPSDMTIQMMAYLSYSYSY